MNRREFLAASAAVVAASAHADTPKPKLKKAVKYGMIGGKGSPAEKLELVKTLGFLGVEADSPSNVNRDELAAARDKTGIAIHGVIDSVHWKDTLSHGQAEIRAKGLKALLGALDDAKFYKADTVLLVPGVVGKDATYDECWQRSTAEVKKAIPHAEKLGVKIAIEVVWNNFLTKPEQLVEYVDQFQTPFVGAYFDCSNMIKYGVPPADWVRKLGPRMLKFDFKAYSKTKAWDVKIGDGDEDWPEIRKALADVGYTGWATAEVKAGGEAWLRDVSERMDRCLGLL